MTTTTTRAGGEKRGNSKDRAARRAFLVAYWALLFGRCECVWCGMELHNHDTFDGQADYIEADRWEAGGTYGRRNIVPACRSCNARREEDSPETFGASMGLTPDDLAIIEGHMLAAPYRGLPK